MKWQDIEMMASEGLRWYASSDVAKRGFCQYCGGNIFWQSLDNPDQVSIMAGSIDAPTGLKTLANIYTEDANDFHIIPDIG
jgi:hypothetical protein